MTFWFLIPTAATIAIWLWIIFGFDYSGSAYMPSLTGIFTIPLGLFLTTLSWLVYFITF